MSITTYFIGFLCLAWILGYGIGKIFFSLRIFIQHSK